MENIGMILNYLLILFLSAISFLVFIKFIKNIVSPVKTVNATVVDKYVTKTISNIHGTFKGERYMIVFLAGNKKLAFSVSEFSYNNYKLKEKGILTYKGNRIIDFS